MRITINAGGRDHAVRVPVSLVLSFVRGKSKETGETIKLDRTARKKLKAAIKDTKTRYGDMPIIEITDKKGEEVTIRL